MVDEPEAFDAQAHRHAQTCVDCAEEYKAVRDDASFAARYLGTEQQVVTPLRTRPRIPVAYAGLAAAAAFVIALFTTPLGSYAQAFLTIFEPKHVVAVAISPNDFTNKRTNLPDLMQIGSVRESVKPQHREVASLAAAQPFVPFKLMEPSTWPQQLPHVATYRVMSGANESFTFSSVKARQYAQTHAKQAIVVPPAMDGAAINANIGPMVVSFLGEVPPKNGHPTRERMGDKPFLTVVQSVTPRVTSTRVTLQQLKTYVLSMPGVTRGMSAEINALTEGTLPIPFRPDKQNAHTVMVQGVQGLAIGDNTGLGAGVIWEKGGVMYGVGGTLAESDVLSFANGLR
jgi:hypothetical protein